MERAVGADADVVDERVDPDVQAGDRVVEGLGGVRSGEVHRDDVDRRAVVGLQFVGQRPQALLAAGDDDQIVAPAGELPGEFASDTRGSAGD